MQCMNIQVYLLLFFFLSEHSALGSCFDCCPGWITAFSDFHNSEDCVNQRRAAVVVKPVNGFGNQINAVLQGFFIASRTSRCLEIKWALGKMLKTNFSRARTSQNVRSSKIKVEFPTTSTRLKGLVRSANRQQHADILLRTSVRDSFCNLAQGQQEIFFADKGAKYRECYTLERCILREIFVMSDEIEYSINEIRPDHDAVLIAVHIRMGDYVAFDMKDSADIRFAEQNVPLVLEAAKISGLQICEKKRNCKVTRYFVASDSSEVQKIARRYFGAGYLRTRGKSTHNFLMGEGLDSLRKMLQDWLILSRADLVVLGPWSTFSEKSLLLRKNRVAIRCVENKSMHCRKEDIILSNGNWMCVSTVVQDTWKGIRSICEEDTN